MVLWKIACQEDKYPGMWQRWFKNQCVAVGWASAWGYKLHGPTKGGKGWNVARNIIKEMNVGDMVIVALKNKRIGRLGQIVGKAIEDDKWDPLVPPGPKLPDGEMGRRIFVRWELTTGPSDGDLVVKLPPSNRLNPGEFRPTAARICSQTVDQIRSVMNDTSNWVGLSGKFGYEKALSDYIASYPGRLEDGLLPHPNLRIRELVFKDKTRSDVLLIDRNDNPVIVECKQNGPVLKDIRQLRHYLDCLQAETGQKARGILVHGGAKKVSNEIVNELKKRPRIEIVNYRLNVNFDW
ncbi:MAG: DUF91 domain-containing protein [Candidatus Omnitrophica bacterium]|nr:DUF91 domain-containing protein [Candidatus Omnitrophota bacterium]MDE2221551.1 DUF91 domain-containing protein [Candidatus Omnitrophota bacterium]